MQGFNLCIGSNKTPIFYKQDENLIKQLVECGDLGHLWDKCFHKDLIMKHNIRFREDFTFAEDEAFVLDYMQIQSDLLYIDTAQYNYVAPVHQKSYVNDNNMGMYFYCLERMTNICRKLGLPLHEVYRNMLNRCGR